MQYGFLFDQSRCMGCNACTVACKDWNLVNPGPVRWRTHKGHEMSNSQGFLQVYNLVMSCNHCEDPACMKSCAFSAISKDERTGIVKLDRTLCQGAQSCLDACPFMAIKIAEDDQEPAKKEEWLIAHPAQKCDMCSARVNLGEEPVCVASCPARALKWGDVENFKNRKDVEQLNYNTFGYAYRNDENPDITTGPSLYIKRRAEMRVVEYGKIED